ncbi:MAG: hypothetical protein M3340_04235 [Actinomycetota bacterium]|nr:hypothetical protein [Actinomycetota bacterium]
MRIAPARRPRVTGLLLAVCALASAGGEPASADYLTSYSTLSSSQPGPDPWYKRGHFEATGGPRPEGTTSDGRVALYRIPAKVKWEINYSSSTAGTHKTTGAPCVNTRSEIGSYETTGEILIRAPLPLDHARRYPQVIGTWVPGGTIEFVASGCGTTIRRTYPFHDPKEWTAKDPEVWTENVKTTVPGRLVGLEAWLDSLSQPTGSWGRWDLPDPYYEPPAPPPPDPYADGDGDGISDKHETAGIDTNGDGSPEVDLPAMGADPNRKDVFVELDWMPPHQLEPAAIAKVVDAFANAPEPIALHVDAGPGSPMKPGATWGSLSRAGPLPHRDVLGSYSGSTYDWSEFQRVKDAKFEAKRAPAFHYALSVHEIGDGKSGTSRPGTPDFIVALGRYCSGDVHCTLGSAVNEGGVFMHELGHTLGLRHGGGDEDNLKPNYPSVMNYAHMMGLRRAGGPWTVDYSRYDDGPGDDRIATLDERSLSEAADVGATGTALGWEGVYSCPSGHERTFVYGQGADWNCDAQTDGVHEVDANRSWGLSTLKPHDDWANLVFSSGSIGAFGRDVYVPPVTEDPETATLDELQRLAAVATGDTRGPKVKIGKAKRRKLTVTATDDREIDQLLVVVNGKQRAVTAAGGKRKLSIKVRLKRGRNKVAATAFDAVGNQAKGRRAKVRG